MSVSSITPLALAELCKGGRKIDLLDVRTPVEFRELHAAGARNVPLDQLDPAIVMQARNGAGNDPLHVICRAGSRGRHGRSPVYCQVGQSGDLATRTQREAGFSAVNVGSGYKTYQLFHPKISAPVG